MRTCPRCHGWSRRVLLRDGETQRVWASDCLMCGFIFGEGLLDYHHQLDVQPEPHHGFSLPVFEPVRRGRIYDFDTGRWRAT